MSSGRRKLKTQSLSQNTGASTSKQSVTNQSTHTNEELDEIDKNVIKCVRYFVLKVGPQQIVHKAELQKTVLYHFGKNFAKIMDKTAEHLRNVSRFSFFIFHIFLFWYIEAGFELNGLQNVKTGKLLQFCTK